MQILLVEDHELTARSICLSLQKYSVTHASNCMSARAALTTHKYDAVLLDLHLPDGSGMELCAELEEHVTQPGVIVLSGRDDIRTKISALDAGADDYVVKPFSPPELIARLHAVIRRRSPQQKQHTFQVGSYLFSPKEQLLSSSTCCIHLTPTEVNLLEKLIKNKGQILTKHVLSSCLNQGENNGNSLEVHMKNLRRKLHLNTQVIETIYGVGYRLNSSYATTVRT